MKLFSILGVRSARALAAALTLVAVALAVLRYAPRFAPAMPRNVDVGVVVLFVPLCLLMVALVVEVARRMPQGLFAEAATPHARAIPHWRDDAD